jgi:hypothetical protein
VELLNRLLVVTEILLAADKDDGQALAEVQHFGDPLHQALAKRRIGRRRGVRTFS